MALSNATYKQYCVQYFRTLYSAGWTCKNEYDIVGYEEICQKIREHQDSDEAVAYSEYCKFRDGLPKQSSPIAAPQQESSDVMSSASDVPDQYTSKDGLMQNERLDASQRHTIIMLLSDIATSCRSIANALSTSTAQEN